MEKKQLTRIEEIKKIVLSARNATKLSLLNFFKSKEDKCYDAIEFYNEACNEYKKARLFDEEYNTYLEIIDLIIKSNKTTSEKKQYDKIKKNNMDLCEYYDKAILTYKKTTNVDNEILIKLMNSAVEIYVDLNRYRSANKYLEAIAKIRKDDKKYDAAIDAYKLALNNSDLEDDIYSSLKYSSEIKIVLLEEKKYKEALVYINEILKKQKSNEDKFRFEITNTVFDVILCKFIINAKQEEKYDLISDIEEYDQMYPHFKNSLKRTLAYKTIKSYEEDDLDAFLNALREYDRITPLTKAQLDIYTEIKNAIKQGKNISTGSEYGVDESTFEVDFS